MDSQPGNAVSTITFNRKVFRVGSRTMAITIPQALAEFFGAYQGCWLKVTLEKLDTEPARSDMRA
jgi:hypothetical protein